MNKTVDSTINSAKQQALAEIEAHRDRKRRAREPEAVAETPEQEIEREVRSQRAQRERQAAVAAEEAIARAAQAQVVEEFRARRDAVSAAERAGRAAGDFRLGPAAPPATRRVAQLLRQRLGDDFNAIVADIRGCDWRSFQNEVERVLVDEECERKHREQQAREAAMAEAAKTLPTPESPEEEEILRRHGFMPDGQAPELDRTAG